MVEHKRLLELIHYEPLTGIFTWRQGTRTGQQAGCFDGRYIQIQIGGYRYLGGRLAWFYMTGKMPEDQIDHKDRNGANDEWINLREATHTQNQYNRRVQVSNELGVKGVRWLYSKYYAFIRIDGDRINLGGFDTIEEASNAYQQAAKKYQGEFA